MNTEKQYIEIKARGYITEREILTLKSRANRGDLDALAITEAGPLRITDEQAQNGLSWLKKQVYKKDGARRSSCVLGNREISILEDFDHFELKCFYDASDNGFVRRYLPVYTVVSKSGSRFSYWCFAGGEINLVG